MLLKIPNLIRQQKAIGHKFILNRKKPLQPRNNNTKNILLGKMIHERIPIKNAFPHLNNIQIMIPQGHPIPE